MINVMTASHIYNATDNDSSLAYDLDYDSRRWWVPTLDIFCDKDYFRLQL